MTTDIYERFRDALRVFLKGNEQAVEFCMMFVIICDKWDDLHDGDKDVSKADLDQIMTYMLVDIPSHPIYQMLGHEIRPIVMSIILRWQDANYLEDRKEELEKCYMLRAGLYDLFSHVVYKLYGSEWYARVGPDIRRLYGESLEDYKQEMKDA